MTDWEDQKRAAQTAFADFEKGVDAALAAVESVDNFYRQIIMKGYVQQIQGDITQQLAESRDLERTTEIEQEKSIEPER
jgi:hypothetical protein